MFNSAWYANLIKPAFSPPDWVFAPVWMFLYFLIFVSLIIYVLNCVKDKKIGYYCFIVQLLLNIVWVPVFFRLKSIGGGFVVIILLDAVVFLTICQFFKVSKIAAILLIPYFLWLLFATYLNIGYFALN